MGQCGLGAQTATAGWCADHAVHTELSGRPRKCAALEGSGSMLWVLGVCHTPHPVRGGSGLLAARGALAMRCTKRGVVSTARQHGGGELATTMGSRPWACGTDSCSSPESAVLWTVCLCLHAGKTSPRPSL